MTLIITADDSVFGKTDDKNKYATVQTWLDEVQILPRIFANILSACIINVIFILSVYLLLGGEI